ncbi:MAG: ABC transporter substrate-binding protein [Planctomycetota bacterium]
MLRRRLSLTGLIFLFLVLAVAPAVPAKDEKAFRIAFVGPLSGPLKASAEESLDGVRIAAEYRTKIGGVGDKGWKVEVEAFDDKDDPKHAVKLAKAILKQKFHAVIAAPTSLTVEPLTEVLRRGRAPVMVVGMARHRPSVASADPMFYIGPWAVDQAMAVVDQLAIHTESEHLKVFGDTLNPAIVAGTSTHSVELADAIARNLGPRQKLVGRVDVAPRGAPTAESIAALKEKLCDRIVLVGEPDLVDHVNAVLDEMKWDVPLLLVDGMLSRAAESLFDGKPRRINMMWGAAKYVWSDHLPPTPLATALKEKHGENPPIFSRMLNGYWAADMIIKSAPHSRTLTGPEAVAAIRSISYGDEEWKMPVFDDAAFADLYQWHPWTHGIPKRKAEQDGAIIWVEDDPEAGPRPYPIYRKFLPTGDIGPMLRTRTPDLWDRVEINDDTTVVWLSFGDENSKQPRTIEKDMAKLGLGTRGYEHDMDKWILDELACRTLGKINKLFLKNYDGTFIDGVSYNIHFTFTKPHDDKKKRKGKRLWRGVIAGDDSAAGGRAWPGEGRVEIYSTFMYRTNALFFSKKMDPKMDREDKKYMDGSYAWGTSAEENIRSDMLRALVDGYSSFFALTGAHEFGHVCGLGHDRKSDRSLMNVVEGAGARDTQCFFIPEHTEVVEKMLGRWKAPRRRR